METRPEDNIQLGMRREAESNSALVITRHTILTCRLINNYVLVFYFSSLRFSFQKSPSEDKCNSKMRKTRFQRSPSPITEPELRQRCVSLFVCVTIQCKIYLLLLLFYFYHNICEF